MSKHELGHNSPIARKWQSPAAYLAEKRNAQVENSGLITLFGSPVPTLSAFPIEECLTRFKGLTGEIILYSVDDSEGLADLMVDESSSVAKIFTDAQEVGVAKNSLVFRGEEPTYVAWVTNNPKKHQNTYHILTTMPEDKLKAIDQPLGNVAMNFVE